MQKSIINRRTKRVLAFLIINIFMLISLVINDKNSVLAAENNYVSIEKVYSEVDLNDDFDGTSVIVVLNRKISGINKVHDNLFKDVEYTAIEDLSIVTDESSIADVSNFEQILKITLPQNSKQNVLKVIEQLSKIDGVKYAGPNRIFKIERAPNDPFYTYPTTPEFGQWGLNTIQSEGAWNFTTGNHSVRVGIIDLTKGSFLLICRQKLKQEIKYRCPMEGLVSSKYLSNGIYLDSSMRVGEFR